MRFRTNRLWRMTGAAALAVLLASGAALAQGGEVALTGLAGGQLTDAELAEGTTIVVVWASWSPRSRDIVERVNEIEADWGEQARVVTVNFQEDRATIESFLEGKNLAVPVFLDSKGVFSKKRSVTTLPGILIYSEGDVVHRGRLPRDVSALIGRVLG
jgi:thiol-disulfide isomerase/thioredoxin